MKFELMTSLQRAHVGKERLWRVWWQWGIPLAALANGLNVVAEVFRESEHPAVGDAVDVLKLLFFLAWCRLAWRCAQNAQRPLWGRLARLTILLGFGVAAVTI